MKKQKGPRQTSAPRSDPVQKMKIFDDLGACIESRWRAKNYSESAFPAIAAQALAEAGLKDRVDAWDTVRWVHAAPQLPAQQDVAGRFGNPPITLYNGPRFYIDIYFWVDGTTEIHQHAFAGAFQVLLGSSIHSRYNFQPEHTVNERFLLGQVVFRDSELLRIGDIRQITPGKDFIHALFHLDRPSATIAVRTPDVPSAHPQYSYRKPCLAVDPFFQEPVLVKKLQSVSLLLGVEHPDSDTMLADLLTGSDFQTAFLVLQTASGFLGSNSLEKTLGVTRSQERFERLLEIARRKHGPLVDRIPPILEEEQRINDLVRRRSSITGKDHRFFLALLLNVPSREKILELVKQYFSKQDPVETILDWVTELSQIKVWGSPEPNVLGIKDFDESRLFALECLLKGLSAQQMNSAAKRKYSAEHAHGRLQSIVGSLRGMAAFRPMLADSG